MRCEKQLLNSAFYIRAELRAAMTDVRRMMGHLINVELVSTGTRMRYVVYDSREITRVSAVVDFTAKDITFRFFFNEPSAHQYKRNVMRFMAIIAYLKDLYVVELGEIYSFVIEALRQDTTNAPAPKNRDARNDEMLKGLNEVNMSLANELSLLEKKVSELTGVLKLYETFTREVIGKFRERSEANNQDISEVLGDMGIEKWVSDAILKLVASG